VEEMKFYKNTVIFIIASIVMMLYVTLCVSAQSTIDKAIGYLDNPISGKTVNGVQHLYGWFLDDSGVAKIEVLVDGEVVGLATYGDDRPDVQKVFPQYNNGKSGYHFDLITTGYADGQHTITIRETGKDGLVTTLPSRIITIDNVVGFLDKPLTGANLTGKQNVYGWFLDESGVVKIEVLVNGEVVGLATYGDARPDVQKVFSQYNNGESGYHYELDTTRYKDGQYTITIRETGENGLVTTLPGRTIIIDNVKGYIDSPLSGLALNGIQNIYGWFLDESGVEKIEILVDGEVAGEATYGDVRTDVQKVFPQHNNGKSGFHFELDTTQYADGKHMVTVRETGRNGQVTTLPSNTITIDNVIGYIDNPKSGVNLNGIEKVYGWFLDESGVAKIEVLLNGEVVGEATYGDSRPDVQKIFTKYNNGESGYHYELDTTRYADGQYNITIRETGNNGQVETLSSKIINIDNVMGYIDTPKSGTILSGIKNVSGWLLDESGVGQIEVLVDGIVVGEATYGDPRPDVQKVFPQYNNGKAGFHYALDTTRFAIGQHNITIRETGKNGRVTTLSGSNVTFKRSTKVFLDPGHGGSDPGAVSGGYQEANINLAVAKKVQSLLLNRGYDVYMSRKDNTYVSLLNRSIMANDLNADIFISIHTNSSGAAATTVSGIESYYYEYDANYPSKINASMHNNPERILKSMTLANIIQGSMVENTGANNRGTDGGAFAVVREAAMPATLLEIGFINNSSERQKLVTNSYQDLLAKAIADGVDKYFKVY
jgi:N-acetylmuramoyl-L-alanine amidase